MAGVDTVLTIERLDALRALLDGAQCVTIVAHARPDGDAMGSMLGLALLLEAQGKQVVRIAPTPVPAFLSGMAGSDKVIVASKQQYLAKKGIGESQLIVHVDHSAISRLDPYLADVVATSGKKKVAIDHHLAPSEEFDLLFSYPSSSSTCELLYELAVRLWGPECITAEVAHAIYLGLMTDTGSFSYSCSHGRTFEVAGHLVEAGADVPAIQNEVYRQYSKERLRMYGLALSEHMEFIADGRAAVIALGHDFLQEYNNQPGDTEGLVNEPLTVASVFISALVTEKKNGTVRISLRAKGNAIVNTLAERYFNGGGHPQASGGTLASRIEAARVRVVEVLEAAIASGECFLNS